MSNKGGLRIPFPDYDYPDEKDKTPIYVEKVEGRWGAYMPRPKCSMTFNADEGVTLPEFITDIKEMLDGKVDYVFRCQLRKEASEHIVKNQFIMRKLQNAKN